MKFQPNKDYKSDDVVMTPTDLAKKLVNHFKPQGKGLEPCCGSGNILRFLKNADWCEINKGRNFFDYNEKVDYIFTNPPWSKIRPFLQHSMQLADNIYFLFTVNHLWTKARLRDIKQNSFGIKEICIFDTPKEFPQSGFQVGMVWLQKNYSGNIIFSELNMKQKRTVVCDKCGCHIEVDDGEDFAYCPVCENDQVEIMKRKDNAK